VTFARVKAAARALPGVQAAKRYDGSTVLKLDGCFVAGLASHPSAEPDTLIVRMEIEDRERLLEDAPDTYYVTDYYRPYPLVLARLSRVTDDALRDLLATSSRLTIAKTRNRGRKAKVSRYVSDSPND